MNMRITGKRVGFFVLIAASFGAGIASGQGAILDMVADTVIQKYQSATCEQLWAAKAAPKSAREQEAIQFLKNDPQARTVFINKIAGPVINKMFECGMVP